MLARASTPERIGRERKHGEDKLHRTQPQARTSVEAVRCSPGQAEGASARRQTAARRALRGAPETGAAAAQRIAHAHSQPLRTDWASARLLSQAESFAHRASGAGLERPGSGHGQVELVR